MSYPKLRDSNVYRNSVRYPLPLPYSRPSVTPSSIDKVKAVVERAKQGQIEKLNSRPRIFFVVEHVARKWEGDHGERNLYTSGCFNPCDLDTNYVDIDHWYEGMSEKVTDEELIANPKLPLLRALGISTNFIVEDVAESGEMTFDRDINKPHLDILCSIVTILLNAPFEACLWLDASARQENRVKAMWTTAV